MLLRVQPSSPIEGLNACVYAYVLPFRRSPACQGDKSLLATASFDATVKLWDVKARICCAFSPFISSPRWRADALSVLAVPSSASLRYALVPQLSLFQRTCCCVVRYALLRAYPLRCTATPTPGREVPA